MIRSGCWGGKGNGVCSSRVGDSAAGSRVEAEKSRCEPDYGEGGKDIAAASNNLLLPSAGKGTDKAGSWRWHGVTQAGDKERPRVRGGSSTRQ